MAPNLPSSPSSPSTPPRFPRSGSRSNSLIGDTPQRLARLLPRRLFPFDRSQSQEGRHGEWFTKPRPRIADKDRSTIDWSHERALERIRVQELLELPGLRGVGERLWDATLPWVVVVLTGIGTGVVASGLDILTAVLTDLRSGSCRDMWWMSKSVCCTGLDVGETCHSWRSWAELAGDETHIVGRALASYSLYITLAVTFAVTASFLVQVYAPFAFHTGIPEIKTILGGYIITDFLSGWTLLIKSLGLPLAVASGLSLGKEGPLVHVACCIGSLAMRPFEVLRRNEARQREILSAAAAAGVSVAFGAPLGGVLFSLEEISTFFPGSTLWQAFVCAIISAVTLQYIDPFNTGKLVLFQVTTSQVWRGFELVPWLALGVAGGLWGTLFIQLNEEWEKLRRRSGLAEWKVTEVAVLALGTAVVSYLVGFMRVGTSELVANLFQDCTPADPLGLCDSSKTTTVVGFLLVTAFAKTLLTAVTFGASLPAGIFLPSLAIGACVGRAVGIVMASIQRAHPTAWLFSSCPADGACISPPVYAVIGAASALGGATRMTISLVVILFELTGAIDLVLQIMMAVMVSKFTGDWVSRDGVYEMWINLRAYPFLNNKQDYRRDHILARGVMTRARDITYFTDEGWTVGGIEEVLEREEYRGFPIVRTAQDRKVVGYISRLELQAALETIKQSAEVGSGTKCFFTDNPRRGTRRINIAGSPRPYLSPVIQQHAGNSIHQQFEDAGNEARVGGAAHFGKGHTRARSSISVGLERSHSLSTGLGLSGPIHEEPSFHDSGAEEVEGEGWVNLQPWVDEIPITLSQDTPMEVVVQMYGRLGLRFMLFTKRGGALTGILTKMDLHAHLQPREDGYERGGEGGGQRWRSKRREGGAGGGQGYRREGAGANRGQGTAAGESIGLLDREGR